MIVFHLADIILLVIGAIGLICAIIDVIMDKIDKFKNKRREEK